MSPLVEALEALSAKALLAAYCHTHAAAAPISCGLMFPIYLRELLALMDDLRHLVEERERDKGRIEDRPRAGGSSDEGRASQGHANRTQPGEQSR